MKELTKVTTYRLTTWSCPQPTILTPEPRSMVASSAMAVDVAILMGRGLTQQQVADALGISRRTVARLSKTQQKTSKA